MCSFLFFMGLHTKIMLWPDRLSQVFPFQWQHDRGLWDQRLIKFIKVFVKVFKKKEESSWPILRRNCPIEFYKISGKSHEILCETNKVDYVLLSNRSVTCTFTVSTVTGVFNEGNELKIHITLQFQKKTNENLNLHLI